MEQDIISDLYKSFGGDKMNGTEEQFRQALEVDDDFAQTVYTYLRLDKMGGSFDQFLEAVRGNKKAKEVGMESPMSMEEDPNSVAAMSKPQNKNMIQSFMEGEPMAESDQNDYPAMLTEKGRQKYDRGTLGMDTSVAPTPAPNVAKRSPRFSGFNEFIGEAPIEKPAPKSPVQNESYRYLDDNLSYFKNQEKLAEDNLIAYTVQNIWRTAKLLSTPYDTTLLNKPDKEQGFFESLLDNRLFRSWNQAEIIREKKEDERIKKAKEVTKGALSRLDPSKIEPISFEELYRDHYEETGDNEEAARKATIDFNSHTEKLKEYYQFTYDNLSANDKKVADTIIDNSGLGQFVDRPNLKRGEVSPSTLFGYQEEIDLSNSSPAIQNFYDLTGKFSTQQKESNLNVNQYKDAVQQMLILIGEAKNQNMDDDELDQKLKDYVNSFPEDDPLGIKLREVHSKLTSFDFGYNTPGNAYVDSGPLGLGIGNLNVLLGNPLSISNTTDMGPFGWGLGNLYFGLMKKFGKFEDMIEGAGKEIVRGLYRGLTGGLQNLYIDDQSISKTQKEYALNEATYAIYDALTSFSSEYTGALQEEIVDKEGKRLVIKDGKVVDIRNLDGTLIFAPTKEDIRIAESFDPEKDKTRKDYRGWAILAQGSQVVVDMAPMILASAATGGGTLGAVVGSALVSSGDYYQEGLRRTGSISQAAFYGLLTGTAIGFVESRLGPIEAKLGRTLAGVEKKAMYDFLQREVLDEVALRGIDSYIKGPGLMTRLKNGFSKGMSNATETLEDTFKEYLEEYSNFPTEFATSVISGYDPGPAPIEELKATAILTPFATMFMSGLNLAVRGKNQSDYDNLVGYAAVNRDKFDQIAKEWIDQSRNEKERSERTKEINAKSASVSVIEDVINYISENEFTSAQRDELMALSFDKSRLTYKMNTSNSQMTKEDLAKKISEIDVKISDLRAKFELDQLKRTEGEQAEAEVPNAVTMPFIGADLMIEGKDQQDYDNAVEYAAKNRQKFEEVTTQWINEAKDETERQQREADVKAKSDSIAVVEDMLKYISENNFTKEQRENLMKLAYDKSRATYTMATTEDAAAKEELTKKIAELDNNTANLKAFAEKDQVARGVEIPTPTGAAQPETAMEEGVTEAETAEPTPETPASILGKEFQEFVARNGIDVMSNIYLGDVEQRMTNAEYIDVKELDAKADNFYKLWDQVDKDDRLSNEAKEELKSKIENLISKLETYELATENEVSTVTEGGTAKGVRIVGTKKIGKPSQYEVTPERIAKQGPTKVTDRDGKEFVGVFQLKDGKLSVKSKEKGTIPIDTSTLRFKQSVMENGTVVGAEVFDPSTGNTYTIGQRELALDMALKAKEMALGVAEDPIFEQIFSEVTTKTVVTKKLVREGQKPTAKTETAAATTTAAPTAATTPTVTAEATKVEVTPAESVKAAAEATATAEEEYINDKDFTEFVDNNKVSDNIINKIADSIKAGAAPSQRAQAILGNKIQAKRVEDRLKQLANQEEFAKMEEEVAKAKEKFNLPIGKVSGTPYEVKQDGVYLGKEKLANPDNKSNAQLIKDDIQDKKNKELERKKDKLDDVYSIKSKTTIGQQIENKYNTMLSAVDMAVNKATESATAAKVEEEVAKTEPKKPKQEKPKPATDEEVETMLEPLGKTEEARAKQIEKNFTSRAEGVDPETAKEQAKLTAKLWQAVAKHFGQRNKKTANEWLNSKLALIGKTSTKKAMEMSKQKPKEEVANSVAEEVLAAVPPQESAPTSARLQRAMSAVDRISTALTTTGIKVRVMETSDEYNKEAQKRGGGKGSEGMFISDEGVIFLDKQKLDSDWGETIVWHEATHPIINIIRNTDPKLFQRILKGAKELSKTNSGIESTLGFAENYRGKISKNADGKYDVIDNNGEILATYNTREAAYNYVEARIADEFVTETIARIASGDIEIGKLPRSFRQSFIDLINSILKVLGRKTRLPNTAVYEFKRKAQEIADVLTSGQDISGIVGVENVTDFKNNIATQSGRIETGTPVYFGAAKTGAASIQNTYRDSVNLPVKTLQSLLNKFGYNVIIINSDPTGLGTVTLPNGEKVDLDGGIGYMALKENIDAGVGFAASNEGRVTAFNNLAKSLRDQGKLKDGKVLVLVMVQKPDSILGNNYTPLYLADALSKIPDDAVTKEKLVSLLKEPFSNKGVYDSFVGKLKKPKEIEGDMSKEEKAAIKEENVKIEQYNKDAVKKAVEKINKLKKDIDSVDPRKAHDKIVKIFEELSFVQAQKYFDLILGSYQNKTTNYKKEISALLYKYAKADQKDLLNRLGEKSFVEHMIKNPKDWGYAVAAFVHDTNKQNEKLEGITHNLFNAKFQGDERYILDKAYKVNDIMKAFNADQVAKAQASGKTVVNLAEQQTSQGMYAYGKVDLKKARTIEFESIKKTEGRYEPQASMGVRGDRQTQKDATMASVKTVINQQRSKGISDVDILVGLEKVRDQIGLTDDDIETLMQQEPMSNEVADRISNNLINHLDTMIAERTDPAKIAQALKDKPGLTRQDINDQVKKLKETRNALLNSTKAALQNAGVNRGAVIENAKNEMIMVALESPNVSTAIHELYHVFEGELSPEEMQTVIDSYNEAFKTNYTLGDLKGDIATDISEWGARLWEKYFENGKQLSEKEVANKEQRDGLQEIFDKFTDWLKGVYNGVISYTNTFGVTAEVTVSKDVEKMFDKILGITPNIATPKTAQDENLQETANVADAIGKIHPNQKGVLNKLMDVINKNIIKRLGISMKTYKENVKIFRTGLDIKNNDVIAALNVIFPALARQENNFNIVLNQPNTNLKNSFTNNPKVKALGFNDTTKDKWIVKYLTTTETGKAILNKAKSKEDAIKMLEQEFKNLGEEIKLGNKYFLSEVSDELIDKNLNSYDARIDAAYRQFWQSFKENKAERIKEKNVEQRQNMMMNYTMLYNTDHYSIGLKLMVLESLLKKNTVYNSELDKVSEKNRDNTTITVPPVLSQLILAQLEETSSESSNKVMHDYFYEDSVYKKPKIDLDEYKNNEFQKTSKGTWYKFKGKNDLDRFHRMSSLSSGKPGEWCTGAYETAKNYLLKQEGSSLYIFYNTEENTVTHQLHFYGNEANEIGGIAKGQDLRNDEDVKVFDDFMESNKDLNAGKLKNYLAYKKALSNLNKSGGDFTKISYEDMVSIHEGIRYYKDDSRDLQNAKDNLPNSFYAKYYNVKEENIVRAEDYDFNKDNSETIVVGNLDVTFDNNLLIESKKDSKFIIAKSIIGTARIYFKDFGTDTDSYIIDQPLFDSAKNVRFSFKNNITINSKLFKQADNVTMDFNNKKVSLKTKLFDSAGGDVILWNLTEAKTKLFDTAGGYVDLENLITATTKLFDTAGESVNLPNLETANTKLFDSAGGRVELDNLITANTKLFDSAGGNVYLRSLTEANTKLFDTAGGRIDLRSLKEANTKLFDSAGGQVDLSSLEIATTKLFDSSVGNVDLDKLITATAKLFDSAGGMVNLPKLEIATTKLFDTAGGLVNLPNLIEANTKLFDSAGGIVNLPNLKKATTKLFDTAGESVYLNNLEIATTKLFDTAGGSVNLRSLKEAKTKLFDSAGEYVNLSSLIEANTKLFDTAGGDVYLSSLETANTKLFDSAKDLYASKLTVTTKIYDTLDGKPFDKDIALNQGNKGLFLRTKDNKKFLVFGKNSDLTTAIHEKAHEYEEVLTEEELTVLEEWSGEKRGTTKFREAFAKGAEKAVYEGIFADNTTDLGKIFKKFSEWFKNLIKDAVDYFADINELNDQVREVYAKMLLEQSLDESVVQEQANAEKASKKEQDLSFLKELQDMDWDSLESICVKV